MPIAGGLTPTAADYHELSLTATVGTPASYDMVRIGYKRIWSGTALDFHCTQRDGPPMNWGSSDENRGWQDFTPVQGQFNVLIPGLSCKAKYLISLYGFQPGSNSGTKLTSVQMSTKGEFWEFCNWSGIVLAPDDGSLLLGSIIATDHAAVLNGYAALLEDHYGGTASLCGGPRPTNCCNAHELPGCSEASCQASVCSFDPFCCDVAWDSGCAKLAMIFCEVDLTPVEGLVQELDPMFPGLADLLEEIQPSLDDIEVFDPYVGDAMFLFLEWLLLDYANGAAFWEWQATDQTLIDSGLLFTDYVAKHAPEVLEAVEASVPLTYGAPSFTQSVEPDVIDPLTSIACVDMFEGVTFDYSHARSFTAPPGGMTVGRVIFGIQSNDGAACPVHVRLLTGSQITGPYEDLTLLTIGAVLVPEDSGPAFYHADFPDGLHVPHGENLIVELAFPNRQPAGGGMIFSGCNNDGQSGPTYVRSLTCGEPNFVDLASLGFPNSHLALTVQSLIPDMLACPADLNNDAVVNAADLAILLGSWSIPPGTPGCDGEEPCQADFNRDGAVNAADLALLLGAWGPCG